MIHLSTVLLHAVLLVAGVASGLIAALALAAFARRRSWAYLLVALALLVFLGRTVLAGLTLATLVNPDSHHLLEHVMDIVTVGLLLGAVYVARTVERPPPERLHD